MYELIMANDQCGYIDSPTKVGVLKLSPREVLLIDSGSDKDAGKKVLRALNEAELTPTAMFLTHSHADHIGGSRLIATRAAIPAYARGIEADFTRHPLLESAFLYGGNPPAALGSKFLRAEASPCAELSELVLPKDAQILSLPGHIFEMCGLLADNAAFIADCVSSPATLQKYHISFVFDVAAQLRTLDSLPDIPAEIFISAHAEPTRDIRPLSELNKAKIFEIAELILKLSAEPTTFEELLARLFSHYSLNMDISQYVLVGSSVRSYLSYLSEKGELEYEFCDNRMMWHRR